MDAVLLKSGLASSSPRRLRERNSREILPNFLAHLVEGALRSLTVSMNRPTTPLGKKTQASSALLKTEYPSGANALGRDRVFSEPEVESLSEAAMIML